MSGCSRSACWLAAIGTLLLSAAALHAGLLYQSQDRLVQAQAGASDIDSSVTSPQDNRSSPDFGPFDATASGQASVTSASASASSHQLSTLGAWAINASGELSFACAGGLASRRPGASANTYGRFLTYFTVDASLPYELITSLDGSVSGQGSGTSAGQILLTLETAPYGTVLNRQLPTDVGTNTLSGTLEPGEYRLLAEFSLGGTMIPGNQDGAALSGTSNYSVTLTVPEPSGLVVLGLAGLTLAGRRRRSR